MWRERADIHDDDYLIAVHIDTKNMNEILVCGKHDDVIDYVENKSRSLDVQVYDRDIGAFLFDLTNSDIQKCLRGYSPDKENPTTNYLYTVINSINEKKANKPNNIYLQKLWDYLERALEFTVNGVISDDFLERQRSITFSYNEPDSVKMLTFMFEKSTIFIHKDFLCSDTFEDYIITDFKVGNIVEYYIKVLYKDKLFPRRCDECGKLFIGRNSAFTVLCSDECREKRKVEYYNVYKEKANDEYEKIYNRVYHKWYVKYKRAKDKKLLTEEQISTWEIEFSDFKSKSYEMRKNARNGNSKEFTRWINNFENKMCTFWALLK
ncbi:MAG: DUF6076 domain-containing protein [Oscillospiraceae bacterium]|nr:DUF6076 domain-containing protein [Oscillospiraceae bacterium]MDY6207801.1 DUF6076 domain-containing protein [Oscillospiraceae bacterium]